MICILKFSAAKEIVGWIIARDLDDARAQIQAVSALSDDETLRSLSEELMTTSGRTARPGMVALDTPGYILLIS